MPRLATAPFDRWKYQDAVKALNSLLPADYARRRKYAVDHDHLQLTEDSSEWVGPGNPHSNDKIQKQYSPDDAVGEALWNIANAFREAQLSFTTIEPIAPGREVPARTQRLMEEAKALISDWWDRVRLHELVQDRLYTSAWAGMAGLRPWIPGRFLERSADGRVTILPATDVATAMEMIHLTAPSPANGGVYVHPQTQEKVAIFLGVDVEIVDGNEQEVKFAELTYLDPERDPADETVVTVTRIVYDGRETAEEVALELGGRIPFALMKSRPILTEPVMRGQQQLNLLCSLITRMAETAAFRERYMKNARPQGMRMLYEEGMVIPEGSFLERDDEDRQWVVVPMARTLGADTTTELVGLPTMNTDGDITGYATPDVVVVDPVDPTPYVNAAESVRRRVLRMCSQGHLSGTSNFEVSGIAYEQARAVFEKDLNARRVAEEGMLRDLIEGVIAMAEYISGQEGYFTDTLRVVVNQHVDAGPRSPDTVRLDHEGFEKGLLSRATAMSRIGVEDLEAEEQMIQADPAFLLDAVTQISGLTFDDEFKQAMLTRLKMPPELVALANTPEAPAPATGDEGA